MRKFVTFICIFFSFCSTAYAQSPRLVGIENVNLDIATSLGRRCLRVGFEMTVENCQDKKFGYSLLLMDKNTDDLLSSMWSVAEITRSRQTIRKEIYIPIHKLTTSELRNNMYVEFKLDLPGSKDYTYIRTTPFNIYDSVREYDNRQYASSSSSGRSSSSNTAANIGAAVAVLGSIALIANGLSGGSSSKASSSSTSSSSYRSSSSSSSSYGSSSTRSSSSSYSSSSSSNYSSSSSYSTSGSSTYRTKTKEEKGCVIDRSKTVMPKEVVEYITDVHTDYRLKGGWVTLKNGHNYSWYISVGDGGKKKSYIFKEGIGSTSPAYDSFEEMVKAIEDYDYR